MKKIAIALLTAMLSTSLLFPSQSHAENQPYVIDGKVVQGRTLVPVRNVSAGLGAEVSWNQPSKTVTIRNGKTEVSLKINSKKVMLDGSEITIDVPAQIDKGVTYVPIRFISQTLGATITWDPTSRVVDVNLGEKQVRITTESTFNYSKIPQEHINTLIKKANEATKLSSYSQIRAHFKSYFTNTLNFGGMIVERTIKLKQIENTWMVDDIIFTCLAP